MTTLQDLKEHAKLLEDVFNVEAGGIAFYRVEQDGRLTPLFAGNNVGKLAGLNQEQYLELCEDDAMKSIFPDDRPGVGKAIHEAIEQKKVTSLTYRIPAEGGGYGWINGSFSYFGEDRGQPVLRAFFMPATIQHDLQLQALNQNEIGVCIMDVETDELYYANDAAFALHGAVPHNYTGQTCCEAFYGADWTCDTCWRHGHRVVEGRTTTVCRGRTLAITSERRQWNGHQVIVVYQQDVTEQQEQQKRLLREEEMLNSACEFAHIWTWTYEISKDQIRTSRQLQRDFGMPEIMENYPSSWLSMGFILPEYVELHRRKVQEIKNGAETVEFDVEIHHADGSEHWSRIRINRLKSNPDNAICTAQLIDNEKYLEARMELEEKRQMDGGANLLAHFVVNVSRDQVVAHTYNFQEREELLTWETTERQLKKTLPYLLKQEKRDQFLRLHDLSYLKQQFAQGKTEETLDYRRLFPSGKIMWVRSVIHLVQNPKSGDIINYEYLYDIHHQKISEELMRAIVSFGFELCASLMLDSDQVTILRSGHHRKNDFEVTSYTKANYVYAQQIMEEDRAMYLENCALENLEKRLEREGSFEIMHRVLEHGEIRYKKDQCYGYAADHTACLLIRSDVTEVMKKERQKQEELKKALELSKAATLAKSEFLSRMSHEIRTPMNAIMGMTAIAKENRTDYMQVGECLDKIEMSSHFLLTLINDILEMSRIESGRTEIRHMEFGFDHLIDSIRTVVEPLALKSGLRYEFINHARTDAYYLGDATRIQQVIVNLIGNAVKFTRKNGRIRFSVNIDSENGSTTNFRFVVADTGIGMSEAFMNKMFQPFTQEDGSNTSEYGGSGLGLAISKSLVEAMGGVIHVESFLGVGSTFTVELPLDRVSYSVSENRQNGSEPQREADLSALKGAHVLMAEDHPLNVTVARKLLERKGVVVTVAENGKLAADYFSGSKPGTYDAILMDIRMPVLDGLDATRLIRSMDRPDARTIPIVAMTANALEEDRKQTREAGMNEHLAKPFDPIQLYLALEKVIKENRSR